MSAEDRKAALRDKAIAGNPRLVAAVKAYGSALTTLRDAEDEIDVARETTRLIVCAEDVIQASEEIALQARKALAAWFEDTGCPSIRTEHHTASLTTPRPKLRVLDPQAVPAEFMVPQPPEPDMAKLKAAYDAGQRFPGVAETNGGPSFITIRARKDT